MQLNNPGGVVLFCLTINLTWIEEYNRIVMKEMIKKTITKPKHLFSKTFTRKQDITTENGTGFIKKMIKVPLNTIIVCSFMNVVPLRASTTVVTKDSAIVKKEPIKTKRNSSLTVVPIPDYTPETKIALGLGAIYYFRRHHEDSTARPSSIAGGFNYTQRQQYGMEIYPELYFNHQKIRVFGKVQVFKFPDWFWGVGDHDPYSKRELYSSQGFNFIGTCLFKLKNGLNIGPRYEFRDDLVNDKVPGGLFSNPDIIGVNGGIVSGLGIVVTHDTRNNIFSPTKGTYLEIGATAYLKHLGSDFRFSYMTVDYRKYFQVFKKSVFATQLYASFIDGSPPFYSLSQFGGHNMMRGYYYGKYINKNMLVAQVEYRFPLFWRFGMVAFAGTGNVEQKVTDIFRISEVKYAFGTGIRFAIKKSERLNARFDIATGRDGFQYYLFFAEAF